jgi:hypothetical protein
MDMADVGPLVRPADEGRGNGPLRRQVVEQRVAVEHLLQGDFDVRDVLDVLVDGELANLEHLLQVELGVDAQRLEAADRLERRGVLARVLGVGERREAESLTGVENPAIGRHFGAPGAFSGLVCPCTVSHQSFTPKLG